jgi:hypothetical protein
VGPAGADFGVAETALPLMAFGIGHTRIEAQK